MAKSMLANKIWSYLFAIQIVVALMSAFIVKANAEILEANDYEEDLMEPSDTMLYEVKRNWRSLNGAWGKRNALDDIDEMDNNKFVRSANNNNRTQPQKKDWNRLNTSWGRRRSADYAARNSAGNAWDKREANWNKLKGMWGKRAVRDSNWHNLKMGFGKRSVEPYAEDY